MESGKEIAQRATSNRDELVVRIWNGKESSDAKSFTTTQGNYSVQFLRAPFQTQKVVNK